MLVNIEIIICTLFENSNFGRDQQILNYSWEEIMPMYVLNMRVIGEYHSHIEKLKEVNKYSKNIEFRV